MGQRPSNTVQSSPPTTVDQKHLFPFHFLTFGGRGTRLPRPQQPIRFQYHRTKRRGPLPHQQINNNAEGRCNSQGGEGGGENARGSAVGIGNVQLNNLNLQSPTIKNNNLEAKCKQNNALVLRTKSEPNLALERNREKHRHRRKSSSKFRNEWNDGETRQQQAQKHQQQQKQQFGYDIQDVDAFLTRASLEKPANIPVVLALPSVLYQTRPGGYQAEMGLPLGTVVNAVFKNRKWLYVQTPHGNEGYVRYAACLPLGIIPSETESGADPTPCWEKCTDVYPKPSGNMTDTEKLSSKSDCDARGWCRNRSRDVASACGERSVDRLYLRAAAISKSRGVRQTLLVITSNFEGSGGNEIRVKKGDVVFLLDANVRGWFYVRTKEGAEGYIPTETAGHGFL